VHGEYIRNLMEVCVTYLTIVKLYFTLSNNTNSSEEGM
jgi:hypothetical protein